MRVRGVQSQLESSLSLPLAGRRPWHDDEATYSRGQIQPPSYEQPGPLLALGNSHRGGDARSVYLARGRGDGLIWPGVETVMLLKD